MSHTIRKSIRVLLLNDQNELLLMCVEGFDVASLEGTRNKRFWCTVGGGIEKSESIEDAALREIQEETGIAAPHIILGPVVWHSTTDLIIKGALTRLEEQFIVARTPINDVMLYKPTEDEARVVKKLQWFSLADIKNSTETIFPVHLAHNLADILAGIFPEQPIKIT